MQLDSCRFVLYFIGFVTRVYGIGDILFFVRKKRREKKNTQSEHKNRQRKSYRRQINGQSQLVGMHKHRAFSFGLTLVPHRMVFFPRKFY